MNPHEVFPLLGVSRFERLELGSLSPAQALFLLLFQPDLPLCLAVSGVLWPLLQEPGLKGPHCCSVLLHHCFGFPLLLEAELLLLVLLGCAKLQLLLLTLLTLPPLPRLLL